MTELVGLLALAAVVGAEGTALGQFMISRPLVTGTIAGALLGDPLQGGIVGAMLEIYYLPVLPIGGGRFPEPGPATVVAVYAGSLVTGAGALALAVFFGLAFGLFGGWTQEKSRVFVAHRLPAPDAEDLVGRLGAAQRLGILVEAGRGLAVCGLGLVIVRGVVPHLGPWPLGDRETWLFLALAACVPMGSLLSVLGGIRRRGGWVLLGALVGFGVGAIG
jgi:mannose/fructose/N-acetylgalactosamine-specific phosphotransferase system component IIC